MHEYLRDTTVYEDWAQKRLEASNYIAMYVINMRIYKKSYTCFMIKKHL